MTLTKPIPLIYWSASRDDRALDGFFNRPAFPERAEEAAREVLAAVRKRGDRAVTEYVLQFDHVKLMPNRFRVAPAEIAAAKKEVDTAFKKAAKEADRRVEAFSKDGLRKDWKTSSSQGGMLGEKFFPLDRIGAYIPGGVSPLVSTAIMTVTLARVAGVKEIVACTPCGSDGSVNPYTLFALDLAGATEIYRLGGIQAIGAMAFGTKTVPKVQKIVGPGNQYVTAAKRQVYGYVDLDLVAGPSEIAVLADESANPRHVAIDLLSQLEHGTGEEKALLITTCDSLAREVIAQVEEETYSLHRGGWLRGVLPKNLMVVVVKRMEEATALSNRFAPEHLELVVKTPGPWLKRITTAGAIFIGPYTPEAAGDFAAGPSHVLPTGGKAAIFSGLTVDAFRRRTSLIGLKRKDLAEVLPIIEAFGRVEALDAHARSARVRFE